MLTVEGEEDTATSGLTVSSNNHGVLIATNDDMEMLVRASSPLPSPSQLTNDVISLIRASKRERAESEGCASTPSSSALDNRGFSASSASIRSNDVFRTNDGKASGDVSDGGPGESAAPVAAWGKKSGRAVNVRPRLGNSTEKDSVNPDEELVFKRAPVPVKSTPVPRRREENAAAPCGGLSQLLKAPSGSNGRSQQNKTHIRIFLFDDDHTKLSVGVSPSTTVEGTIIEALAVHAREGSRSGLRLGKQAEKFELRLHECDGLPDDDLPALEQIEKDHAVRRSGILLMPRGRRRAGRGR